MRKQLCTLSFFLALAGSFALAQTMPGQRYPNQTPPTLPENQPPASGVETHVPPANLAAVQSDIQSAIQKDPTLANANVNVQVTDKNVELTGTVPNKDAKHTAEQIAKAHAGGLDIKNHLKVDKSSVSADQTNPKEHKPDR